MKTQKSRVTTSEHNTPMVERMFYAWPLNPWTPEQAVEAMRRHPDQMIFWRSAHELPVDTAGKMKYPDEDMTGARAQDWRAREMMFCLGQWEDFVAVPVRRMRKERSWLVFLMIVRRHCASVVATAVRQARGIPEPVRLP